MRLFKKKKRYVEVSRSTIWKNPDMVKREYRRVLNNLEHKLRCVEYELTKVVIRIPPPPEDGDTDGYSPSKNPWSIEKEYHRRRDEWVVKIRTEGFEVLYEEFAVAREKHHDLMRKKLKIQGDISKLKLEYKKTFNLYGYGQNILIT